MSRIAVPVLRAPVNSWLASLLALAALCCAPGAQAQAAREPETRAVQQRSLGDWLLRMHEAAKARSYVGTFIVSSNSGSLASARIWHACEGETQVERVETLTGVRRSTVRRNDEVVTLLPESRTARTEQHDGSGAFPELLKGSAANIPDFYEVRRVGEDRVAGFDADVLQIAPRDGLRFGYRVWSERKTGLVVKTQVLDGAGAVLEQAAFSELQIDAPLKANRLAQAMAVPGGWRVERARTTRTTPEAEGWSLKTAVAGFKPLSCHKRPAEGVVQWMFSDGLASVSLFIEALDPRRHTQEGVLSSGATHTLTRRLQDWWLTAVGEVPPQTLSQFAQALERRR